jgi:hypothetical protein
MRGRYKLLIWLLCFYISYQLKITEICCILCGLYLIYDNLGERKGASAYSVFNKGCKTLAGDFRADSMILMKNTEKDKNSAIAPEIIVQKQKYANKPCPCGSGLKHKKCCLHKKMSIDED